MPNKQTNKKNMLFSKTWAQLWTKGLPIERKKIRKDIIEVQTFGSKLSPDKLENLVNCVLHISTTYLRCTTPRCGKRLEIAATNIITSKGFCMLGKIKHHTEHDTIQKKAKQIRSPSAEQPLAHQKEPKFKTQRPITKSKRNRDTQTPLTGWNMVVVRSMKQPTKLDLCAWKKRAANTTGKASRYSPSFWLGANSSNVAKLRLQASKIVHEATHKARSVRLKAEGKSTTGKKQSSCSSSLNPKP